VFDRNVLTILLVSAITFLAATTAQGSGKLVDPTRPPNVLPGGRGGGDSGLPWKLSAILVAKGRRVAVVNGQTVQAGERVDGATIKKIARTGVVLGTPQGDLEVPLVGSWVKLTEANRR